MIEPKFTRGALALTTALAFAAPTVFAPGLAQAYVFSNVRIVGAERIEPATILSYANISRGAEVSAGDLNDALQRLQNSGLFETVEVTPQGGTLIITVREYPTINVISFEGNRRVKDEALAEVIQSKSRRVFSPSQAEADAHILSQLYASQGRLAARVTPKIIRRNENRVDLVFEVDEGDVTEIERISFTGNRAYSDRRLRQVLQTKQAGILRNFIKRDTFQPDRIPLDEKLLSDFYLSRGYADFKVQAVSPEVARERDAFFVQFQIQEGPRYKFGNVTTISEVPGVDAAAFAAQNRVKSGDYYNPAHIDNTIRRMEVVAIDKGLDFINIEPRVTRNPRQGTLDLTLAITRGPRVFIERIDIEGNTTTLDEVIRRQFNVVEGDPFNPREIRNSAERIRALGYFADAQVEARPGRSPDQVIVDVNVEEQPTGSLSFGVSYGRNAGAGFNVGLSEQNFLGRGQFVSLSFSTGTDNKNTAFTFIEPNFLNRDLKARISAWYRTTDQDDAKYNTRSIGFSTGLEFPISQNGRLELRYKLAKDTISDVTELSSEILQREDDWGGLVTSALGYGYRYDSRITGLNPETGYLFRFNQDFGGLGGDVDSITSTGFFGIESTAWRPEVTLRGELEAGAVHMFSDDTDSVLTRFTGNSTIRGFEPNGIGPRDLVARHEDALGGNYYWVARAEAQFPIGLPEEYGVLGGVFFDVGSVWGLDDRRGTPNEDGSENTIDDDMHIRSSVGVSVFWDTPIGPLRMNFSKAIKKKDYDKEQNFDLTVSTSF